MGYWLTQDLFWAQASLWLIGAGLVGGVLAAITGLSDFFRIDRVRKRSAGWAHLILNIAVLVLTVVNYVLRLGDSAAAIVPVGIILSVIVSTLLGVSGWYGAELVYRHKVAVIGYSSRQES